MTKEKHSETKSHRVGRATLFSRQTRRTPTGALGVPTNDPVCLTCRPLRLEDTGEGL